MKRKINGTTLGVVQAALIAACYVVINYSQEFLIPSTTSGPVQFRMSEILCTLVLFMPAAIPGVTVGCFISNFVVVGVLPIDIILGTLATLLAAICAYKLRNIKWFKIPLLSLLMPVIFNAVIIGLELEIFFIKSDAFFKGFLYQAGLVAAGEFVVCVLGGAIMYLNIAKTNLFKENIR